MGCVGGRHRAVPLAIVNIPQSRSHDDGIQPHTAYEFDRIGGDADFFRITKRLRNRLRGARDAGDLGADERAICAALAAA